MGAVPIVISLKGLRFSARHGILPQERSVGGDFVVDVVLHLSDAAVAVRNDILSGTVNYAEVYEIIRREMLQPSALLEHAAGRIIQALFRAFSLVERVEVELTKVAPPIAGIQCAGISVRLNKKRN